MWGYRFLNEQFTKWSQEKWNTYTDLFREMIIEFRDMEKVVLCMDGHEVCDIVRDLHTGEIEYSSVFQTWRENQQKPKKGDLFPLLCHCGSPWFIYHQLVNTA